MKRTKNVTALENTTSTKPIPSIDEIFEDVTKSDKAWLLRSVTDISTRMINMKQDIFHIGQVLSQAKGKLHHGQFQPWIKYFFNEDLPYSTANFYMRVYKTFNGRASLVKYIPSKYLMMLIENDFPEKVLDQIKSHPEKINSNSLKQINEVYGLWKEGTIGGSQFLKLANDQIVLGIDIAHKSTLHRINATTRLSFELGAGDILKRIRELRKIARSMAGLYPYDPESKQHQNLLLDIDKTIAELNKLKDDLESKQGFWRNISSENGVNEISNN